MLSKNLFWILLFAACSCHASPPKPKNLCLAGEKMLLNCVTKSKLASVCASGDATNSGGYAKYRFGTPEKIELEFPKQESPPSSSFLLRVIPRPGGGNTKLSFTNQEYSYRIEESSGYPAGDNAGFESTTNIIISKKNKTVKKISCENEDSGLSAEAYEIFEKK
jgi:hypothetical protein